MKVMLIHILIVMFALAAQAAFMGRVDPHGEPDEDFHKIKNFKSVKKCTICHEPVDGQAKLRSDYDTGVCFNCHNKLPHSGSADHLGKEWKNPATGKTEQIHCQSCHTQHRYGQKAWTPPSGFFKRRKEIKGPFEWDPKRNPMLQRVCTDCHK